MPAAAPRCQGLRWGHGRCGTTPPAWHCPCSPPWQRRSHWPPPASPLFCKPCVCVCVNVAGGGPTGTGWAHSTRDTPHPCHQGEARVSGGGHPCNACQAPAIPEGGGPGSPPATRHSLPPTPPSSTTPIPHPPCPPQHSPGGVGSRGVGGGSRLQHQQPLGLSSLPRGCCSSSSRWAKAGARGGPRSPSSSLRCACSTSSVSRVKDCGRGVVGGVSLGDPPPWPPRPPPQVPCRVPPAPP